MQWDVIQVRTEHDAWSMHGYRGNRLRLLGDRSDAIENRRRDLECLHVLPEDLLEVPYGLFDYCIARFGAISHDSDRIPIFQAHLD